MIVKTKKSRRLLSSLRFCFLMIMLTACIVKIKIPMIHTVTLKITLLLIFDRL